MMLVNLGFHTQKNFSKIICDFGTRPQDGLPAVIGQKSLKNIGFLVCQIISLPGMPIINLPKTPTWLRPALILLHELHSLYMTK